MHYYSIYIIIIFISIIII